MSDRRSFLRGLASLPLIGGGVTLIGHPTGTAVPVTADLLDTYDAFLFYERKFLVRERFGHLGPEICRNMMRCVRVDTAADRFHFPAFGSAPAPMPSARAAVILSAAGVPLFGGDADG